MATMNPHISERRHIPDRRATGSGMIARHMTAADWVAMVFLIVGGLNWGLIGLFDFNLVAALFGETSGLSRLIYLIVGIAALYSVYLCSKMARRLG